MLSRPDESSRSFHLSITRLAALLAGVVVLMSMGVSVQAQTFNSGSTGADGAFAPTQNTTLQIPDSGVFNFTTINIPAGVEVRFTKNSKNTPVTMLATGNVTILGRVILDGEGGSASSRRGGVGGPGGFRGGDGALGIEGYQLGNSGDGPGGGGGNRCVTNLGCGYGGGGGYSAIGENGKNSDPQIAGQGGPSYGKVTLLLLIGGSGGGGGPYNNGGGGGGGAILIASSTTIVFSGVITAMGGNGVFSNGISGSGGGGAGGAIRVVANTISGVGNLSVSGGQGGFLCCYSPAGGNGSPGYVRIEAYDAGNFSPSISGLLSNSSNFSLVQPRPAIPSNLPQLRITSVGGIAVPANPVGSFSGIPDITLPASQADPVPVALAASNIPTGTVLQVTATPETGARTTVNSTALTGTLASSTASANVTIPATGQSVICATVTVNLVALNREPVFMQGERVDRVEISATFGAKSEITYITESGKRIKRTSE